MSRAAASQLSFADWELMRQGLELEPLLQAISDFLDDHEELVARIRGDLRRGLKKPDTGRNGLAPREVLRSLVLMRVKNWDYRELRERIADGYTLRLFTGFHCRPVPKHNAFHRAFVRLTPATLRSGQRAGGEGGGRSRIGGRHEAAGRHDGGADRHPSSDRQHVAVGCRARSVAACSAVSASCWADASRASATARARRGGGCRPSSG